jgi:Pectate lyase superfamily protein
LIIGHKGRVRFNNRWYDASTTGDYSSVAAVRRSLTSNHQTVGAEAIIDAVVINTPIFVRNSNPSNGTLAGSLVINNAKLTNVPTAVGVVGGAVVLYGGTTTILSWGQGNVYTGTNVAGTFMQGNIFAANKPSVLLDGSGRIFGKMHPQYASYDVNQFVSVKDNGAKGDGNTDDTAALQAIFNQARPMIKLWPSHLIFCESSVFWLQNHLRRCWHIHRFFDSHYSGWNPDCR